MPPPPPPPLPPAETEKTFWIWGAAKKPVLSGTLAETVQVPAASIVTAVPELIEQFPEAVKTTDSPEFAVARPDRSRLPGKDWLGRSANAMV